MAMYRREEIPSTTSWVTALNAQQAIDQCAELGIVPSRTLEENRVLLRRYVQEGRQRHSQQQEGISARPNNHNIMDLDNLMLEALGEFRSPEIRAPPPQILPPQSLQIPQRVQPVPASSPASPSRDMVHPQVGPVSPHPESRAVSDSFAPLARIPEQILVQMHELTTEAVCQTVRAFTDLQQSTGRDESNIPHFLRDMIRDLPKCDGINLGTTVGFLKGISKLLNLNLAQERAVLLNVTTQTIEPFRQFWVESVAASYAWEQVVTRFRDYYLTPEKLRLARNEFLYRAQGRSEKLGDFVSDMELSYQILAPQTSQGEIFQTIFCRINAETRNCLAGLSVMRSTQDLVRASPTVESIRELAKSTPNTQERADIPVNRQTSARQGGWSNSRGHFEQARGNAAHRSDRYNNNNSRRWRDHYPPHHTQPHQPQQQAWQQYPHEQGNRDASYQPQQLVFPFPPPNYQQQQQQQSSQQQLDRPPTGHRNLNSYARR